MFLYCSFYVVLMVIYTEGNRKVQYTDKMDTIFWFSIVGFLLTALLVIGDSWW
jgi:hypothetical protein